MRWSAFGTLALIMCAALSGCIHTSRLSAPAPKGFIQVDIETSPTSLDPRYATDAVSSRIGGLLFDSLVRVDGQQRFTGELAASFERPTDTTIVFHLRHGVRFSNGDELTARDVKYTYDSVLALDSASPKRAGFGELASITAPDDYTIVMTTRRPYAPALEMGMLGVVPAGTPAPGEARITAPPGSGPFMVKQFVRDEKVVLTRNPYRPGPPDAPAGIVLKIVPDATVRALELEEGVCDFAENNISPDLLDYLAEKPSLVVNYSPGTSYQYLAFNFRDSHLRDVRVRRAFAYAINRAAIVSALFHHHARVATGMLSPENWAYYGDVKTYSYDPAKADHLLDQAGYPRGPDGWRKLTFSYKTTPENSKLAQVLQAMLKRVGVKINVKTLEWATFYGDIQRGDFDLASLDWVGINDPHHYYLVFDSKMTPPHGLNRGDYSNPEMDRLLEAGDHTLNPDARRRIYAQVQKLAAEDLPYLPLWWRDNVVVMKRNIQGFKPYPNGSLRSLADVTLAHPRR